MNEALRLQVSAYVDGELPDSETELLMRRLSQDQGLRELVADYLRIGRLIRRDREVPGIETLRGRIQAALGEQPAEEIAEPAMPPGNRFLRPVAGLAIASAVAAVALLGLRQVDPPGAEPIVESAPNATVAARAGYTEPQPSEVLNDRPSELLMQYYLSHDATSRDLGANGILTRFVTLELREGELVPTDPARSVAAPADVPGAREVRTDVAADPARPDQ